MNAISIVEWDSDFFGYKVGKIVLSSNIPFDYHKFVSDAREFKLVYIFSDDPLTYEGIKLVDRKVKFSKKISGANIPPSDLIHPFQKDKHDYSQLEFLALQSGIFSRFNADKNFVNSEYERLYLHWLNQSLESILAFEVLVAVNRSKILGFITIAKQEMDISSIGLIAVSKESRGMGIGMSLINSALKVSCNVGYKKIEVVTQFDNIPAMNLYRKCDFTIQNTTNIYHFWNL